MGFDRPFLGFPGLPELVMGSPPFECVLMGVTLGFTWVLLGFYFGFIWVFTLVLP